jgi:hypothetical protein
MREVVEDEMSFASNTSWRLGDIPVAPAVDLSALADEASEERCTPGPAGEAVTGEDPAAPVLAAALRAFNAVTLSCMPLVRPLVTEETK